MSAAKLPGLLRPAAGLVPLAVAALTISACSSGSDPAPAAGTTPPSAASAAPPAASGASTPIRIRIGDTVLGGTLRDSATSRSLIAQLPLTLSFSDLNGEEKVGHLSQPLSMDGMPAGDDPVPRDIGYYAPWGNVVFYYGDVGYWNGIARIGQFDGNVDAIQNQHGDFTATIELAR